MAKRRANHEGTIFKRKNGSWRAQVSIQGRRLSHTAKTQRECKEWLKETIQHLDQGYTYRSAQTSLEGFLENWLVSIQCSRAPGTLNLYRLTIRNEIIPALGHIKLKDLSPDKIQRLFDRKLAEGASPYAVKRIHKVLHVALGQGVKLGLLTRNQVSTTVSPRITSREMQYLTEREVQAFLELAKQVQAELYALYFLAIHTEMRKSELLGLQWEDIDWQHGTLQVQRQLRWKRKWEFEFTVPKTSKGIRSIKLGKKAIAALNAHKESQTTGGHDLIFADETGEPIRDHRLYRNFKQILEEADLHDIRFHDLRHTAASLMLNYGVPVIIVSRRLGHAKPSITMDVYGHIIPSRQEEAASLMDRLMTV
jgi:integrase